MSLINLKSPTELSGFYVIFKGSTNLEKKGNYGISHLMEHLLCKSLDPYQDELHRLGITHNAYTSENEIVFFMYGLEESIKKWRYKFVNLITDFNITKDDLEKEKSIVLQEYMDSFNDQQSNHMLNLERKIYNNFNPIGLKEDIEKISYLDCLNFYEKQFQYPSTIINVSKENEFKIDINFQNENINHDFKMGEFENPLERKNKFKEKVSFIMTSREINENFGKIKFINQLLANGLNSPLYQEIREKNGLSYFVGAHLSRLNKQAFNTIFTVSTEPHIEKITSLISDIFNNLDKHLTRERFNTIKEYLIIKEKQKDINRYKNVTDWIEPDNFSVKEIINDISYIDVLTIADKYFNMDNYHISRDDKEF